MSAAKAVARFIGRKPKIFLFTTLGLCAFFTVIAITLGNLNISFDSKGWKSRGTKVSKRAMQSDIVLKYRQNLFFESFDGLPEEAGSLYDSPWDYLQQNTVPGYIKIGTFGRRLASDPINQCESTNWFSEDFHSNRNHLSAIWITKDGNSLLEPNLVLEMCKAERLTAEVLGREGFCSSCAASICLEPHSLIYLISSELGYSKEMSTCEEIVEAYSPLQDDLTQRLVGCANAMRLLPGWNCTLQAFASTLVDSDFGVDNNLILKYSSSIFFTSQWIEEDDAKILYRLYPSFGRTDSKILSVVYDTKNQDLNILSQIDIMTDDVKLAFVSVVVTTLAIFLHTKSAWLTLIGCLQIIFAAPLAYCVYYFIGGLKFFPVINLIGLFVSSALGADDLFVAVDKWKNARIAHPSKSTEDVAEIALPDAAAAMLLTTSTTGVAFFSTCITPVPPIFTFALFCGLLVIFNYVLNCALVFPALCLYDAWILQGSNNKCVSFTCIRRKEDPDDFVEGDSSHQRSTSVSLIHKILSWYYKIIHGYKFLIIVLMAGALAISTYFAIGIKLPENSEVRMLPSRISFEQHYEKNTKLLSYERIQASGSLVRVFFGVKPVDTGSYRNPDTLSAIVLDETFDPSSFESQLYLKTFCGRLWEQDFAKAPPNYRCQINSFDDWLGEQFALSSDSQDSGYVNYCSNTTNSLPMDESKFHKCFLYWKRTFDPDISTRLDVLGQDDIVKIMWFEAMVAVHYNDPYNVLNRSWKKFESWIKNDAKAAPSNVSKFYHTGGIWWWKDTNGQMLNTAVGAAAITILFSAAVVLVSSRSLRLTLFSCLSIAYILAGATASLVGVGWTLGFLESVCFAILIGISCDFVIHFGHEYISFGGYRTREERTKYATIHMGPSVLAAALTTFSAALVMIFCTLRFFTQFSQMLLLTITHAIIGSFVVYLVLCDAFGPGEPTKLYDAIVAHICGRKATRTNESDGETENLQLKLEATKSAPVNTENQKSKIENEGNDSFHDTI